MRIKEMLAKLTEINARTNPMLFEQDTIEDCKKNLDRIREVSEELSNDFAKLIKDYNRLKNER